MTKNERPSSVTKTKTTKTIAVLITTIHRGVFFGYAKEPDIDHVSTTKALKVTAARNCLRWSSALGGFLGLANLGPDAECKIGPRANLTILDITSVAEVSPAAVDRWEGANTSWR